VLPFQTLTAEKDYFSSISHLSALGEGWSIENGGASMTDDQRQRSFLGCALLTVTYGTARAEVLLSSAAAESYSEGAIGLFPVAWRIFGSGG
jgi:hypothetical protein